MVGDFQVACLSLFCSNAAVHTLQALLLIVGSTSALISCSKKRPELEKRAPLPPPPRPDRKGRALEALPVEKSVSGATGGTKSTNTKSPSDPKNARAKFHATPGKSKIEEARPTVRVIVVEEDVIEAGAEKELKQPGKPKMPAKKKTQDPVARKKTQRIDTRNSEARLKDGLKFVAPEPSDLILPELSDRNLISAEEQPAYSKNSDSEKQTITFSKSEDSVVEGCGPKRHQGEGDHFKEAYNALRQLEIEKSLQRRLEEEKAQGGVKKEKNGQKAPGKKRSKSKRSSDSALGFGTQFPLNAESEKKAKSMNEKPV
ncbi:hypothetical protein L596_023450 [Steinernema carpocapsae]|uniref:Uncharacterized protein n=1 Tax=Steinernema carpocapsae TaxID=34508 RepID=A0A4U5MEG2_STECR|nr:hypothetical protein L596_023450 [Steinernema carpocapsae]